MMNKNVVIVVYQADPDKKNHTVTVDIDQPEYTSNKCWCVRLLVP